MSEQEEIKKSFYNILLQVTQTTPILNIPANGVTRCKMCNQHTNRYYGYFKKDITFTVIQNFADLQEAHTHQPIGICCINEKHQEKMRKMIEKTNIELKIQQTERKIKEQQESVANLEKTRQEEHQQLKRIKLDLGMDGLTI